MIDLKGGVCVGSNRDKAGISQSTVSHYLDMLQKAGLLLSERHGKWTYYRRDEDPVLFKTLHIDKTRCKDI